ncbi:MAG: putative porin [Lentimicrobiaceae bacterium]|nr:putative porin [Lentimicrobiaceae bacterium]
MNSKIPFFFSSLFFLSANFLLFSQKTTVNNNSLPQYYSLSRNCVSSFPFTNIDTSIRQIQKYDPIFNKVNFYANLGNLGSPYRNLLFFTDENIEFKAITNPYEDYVYRGENIRFYNVTRPYTELKYVMGSKKEQSLKIQHSQSVRKNLTLGFTYQIINSPGYYKYQKTNNNSLALAAAYNTDNKRYSANVAYTFNRFKTKENGGIVSDSTFENNLETDREVYLTNLKEAESHYRESGITFQQSFYLGRIPKNKIKESKQTDSTLNIADSTKAKENFRNIRGMRNAFCLGTLHHRFDYHRQSSVYADSDPVSGFYSRIYSDSVQTLDSTHVEQISNEFFWSNHSPLLPDSSRILRLYFGVKHQYSIYNDNYGTKYFSQVIPSAGFVLHPIKISELNVNVSYVTGTYNDGDYLMNARLINSFGKTNQLKLEFSATYLRQMPAWFYSFYRSNHFYWMEKLKPQELNKLGATLSWKGYSACANYFVISHFTFLDEQALPAQDNSTLKVFQINVRKNFRLGGIHFDNNFAWQKIMSSDALHLPEIMLNFSLYYQMSLFNNALLAQVGLDASYNSAYYADAYMPALHSFYLQKEKKIGDYCYGDVFINFQVKRANLFVKYQHFNSWFGDYRYYASPHYPMPDAGFRFGVSWRFYD